MNDLFIIMLIAIVTGMFVAVRFKRYLRHRETIKQPLTPEQYSKAARKTLYKSVFDKIDPVPEPTEDWGKTLSEAFQRSTGMTLRTFDRPVHSEITQPEYIPPQKLSGRKYPESCKSCGQNQADYTEIDYMIYRCNFCETVSDGRTEDKKKSDSVLIEPIEIVHNVIDGYGNHKTYKKPIIKVPLSPNDIISESIIRPNTNIEPPKFDVSQY